MKKKTYEVTITIRITAVNDRQADNIADILADEILDLSKVNDVVDVEVAGAE